MNWGHVAMLGAVVLMTGLTLPEIRGIAIVAVIVGFVGIRAVAWLRGSPPSERGRWWNSISGTQARLVLGGAAAFALIVAGGSWISARSHPDLDASAAAKTTAVASPSSSKVVEEQVLRIGMSRAAANTLSLFVRRWIGGDSDPVKDGKLLMALCDTMEQTPREGGGTLFMGYEPVAVSYEGRIVSDVWPAPYRRLDHAAGNTCTFLFDPRIADSSLHPDSVRKVILIPLDEAIAGLPDYSTTELRSVINERVAGRR